MRNSDAVLDAAQLRIFESARGLAHSKTLREVGSARPRTLSLPTGSRRYSRLGNLRYRLPLDDGGGPRQAGAEDYQQHEVATLDSSLLDRLVQRDGNGRRRGVAVLVQVHK